MRGAGGHGHGDGGGGATAAEEHGRGQGTAHGITAFVMVAAGQREKDWGGRVRVRVRRTGTGVVDGDDGYRALGAKRLCLGGSWWRDDAQGGSRGQGEDGVDGASTCSGVRVGGVHADRGMPVRQGRAPVWTVQGRFGSSKCINVISVVRLVY
jgi:hypothetical protein